ncbi:hypothetical protein OIV83_004990 [Microbotryomycetes sp. JL201]|nr:hypothetical protein OIV83_004990 [Microbotryomycetes sp. JL201]
MLTTRRTITVAAFAATLVSAGGSIDNSQEANAVIAAASQLSGSGTYVFENAATGQVLSFSRQGGTTNFYPNDDGSSVDVQFADGAARISGGNNKCASAQWSYDVEGGVDHAAVSYACAVGEGEKTGTDTLEKTKQWWYLVAVDGGDSGGDNNNSGSDAPDTQDDSAASTHVMLAAQPAKNDNKDDSTSSGYLSHAKGYYEYPESTIPLDKVDTSGVNKKDRASWICRHPGWWLNNHPGYVDAGHPECASDLKAYRSANKRLVKRSKSAHHDMAEALKLRKRGDGQKFYIIAQDHLWDMATRAVGSDAIGTYGGYTSTILSLWDKSDPSQMWTITSA